MAKPISVGELLTKQFAETHYIIGEGLLAAKSLMFIGGPPKSFKSFVLTTILYHLVTGSNLFGSMRRTAHVEHLAFPIPNPKRVLLLEQEIGYEEMQLRFRALHATLPPHEQALFEQNFHLVSCDHGLELNSGEGIARIENCIRETKPDIVALDPLVEFHLADENSSKDMMRVFRVLDRLRETYGCAFIVNHHITKPDVNLVRSGPDLLRGSSTIFAKGDSYLIITPVQREHGRIRMDFTIRRGKPIAPLYLIVDFNDLRAKHHDWVRDKQAIVSEKVQ